MYALYSPNADIELACRPDFLSVGKKVGCEHSHTLTGTLSHIYPHPPTHPQQHTNGPASDLQKKEAFKTFLGCIALVEKWTQLQLTSYL